jgi:hypothetical protein
MNNNFEIYSAGILPYTIYRNNLYFLLGRDYDQKWSDFGGRVEPKDKYDPEITAIREFNEESLGAILDIDYLKKIIRQKKYIKIISTTNSGHNYYMYLIKIQYLEIIKLKFMSTKNFLNTIPHLDKKYKEKNDIRWVSVETIENSLNNKAWILLRNVFFNTFKNNLEEIKTKCNLF